MQEVYLKNGEIPKDLTDLGMQTADIVKTDLQHGANNIVPSMSRNLATGKPLLAPADILQDAVEQSLPFLIKTAV